MTDRSESREDDRTDLPTGEQTDAGPTEGADDSEHLDDIEDGAGCAEIWERLSEQREADRQEAEQDA